jgi:hypothetical protein
MGRLTIRIFKDEINPRTFRVPESWFTRLAIFAWLLVMITLGSLIYAARLKMDVRSARPEKIQLLEQEVQDLKVALEKTKDSRSGTTLNVDSGSTTKQDAKATDQKPEPGPGAVVTPQDGVWGGLARGVTAPPAGFKPAIKIEDARLNFINQNIQFTGALLYQDPGKGSQQGHLIILARGADRLFAHPEGVLNFGSGDALLDPNRGEYFSVSRYRPIKVSLGPFNNKDRILQVQVYVFDLSNRLILLQTINP